MSYVRVNMVELKSHEDTRKDMDTLKNNMKSLFPEMCLFISMEVSEISNI